MTTRTAAAGSRGWGIGPDAAAASGALLVALAVAIGAFGTHMLGDRLPQARLDTLDTAIRYHFIGALGLILVSVLARARGPARAGTLQVAAGLLLAGTTVFCCTLYGLVAGGPGWLGAITPVGGLAIIAAWLTVALTYLRR
jgi:uncharacterized membrane protein YgdD (TMEM256/DUF423 family)